MAGVLPDGDTVPSDGSLPPAVAESAGRNGFGVYDHVPFCASRCGYCDFNTYTASELVGGVSRDAYAGVVLQERDLARKVIEPGRADTVFVGGGTPTLLGADDLGRVLEGIDRAWGLAPGAAITTEANPAS